MNSEQLAWLRTMQNRRVFADLPRTHDMFAHAQSEMANYLNSSGHRFLRTLELVKRVTPAGARVLEIGANPYFVTAVLLQNFKLAATSMGPVASSIRQHEYGCGRAELDHTTE